MYKSFTRRPSFVKVKTKTNGFFDIDDFFTKKENSYLKEIFDEVFTLAFPPPVKKLHTKITKGLAQ